MQFKTFKYFSMAALALMTAACSNEDNDLSTAQQPSSGIPFTATIATGSSAMTRALREDTENNKITASWAVDEQVALIYTISGTAYNTTAKVSSVDGNGKATIEATLQNGVTDDTDVTLIYPASAADGTTGNVKSDLLLNQDGKLATIASKYDVRKGTGKITVSGSSSSLKEDVTLTNQYAIWKMTLNNSAKNLYITADGVQIAGATLATAGTAFYVAVPAVSSQTISVVANNGTAYYTKTHTGVTLAAGKYYQSSVTTTALTTVDVSKISGTTYIENNSILTGSCSGNNWIIIYNGTTVILNGVNITNTGNPGLECEGSATIILVGSNTVTGENGPGIKAGGSGTTLTITGTGSLKATGSVYHAGIGSGNNKSCGNITISGGTVTATGGENGAGIGMGCVDRGSTSLSCGDITISGGTVTAQGGNYAAGIGTGYVDDRSVTCGAITITTGVTKVTAKKGGGAECCIGKGRINDGGTVTIGTITIGGTVYADGISDSKFNYRP